MQRILINIYRYIKRNLYTKPKAFLSLIYQKQYYINYSYYPELKSKSKFCIYLDQCRQIMKYGSPNKYYFLYGFDTKTIKEQDEYVHSSIFSQVRDKLNLTSKHNSSCILRNKIYFSIFANAIGINTPTNVAFINNNNKVFLFTEKKYISIEDFTKLGDCELFCKTLDGECGYGIFRLKIKDNSIYINDTISNIQDLRDILNDRKYLFQEYVIQHHEIQKIYNKSINTIRLATVRDPETKDIIALPSSIRIGAYGSIVDNSAQGGVSVGINLQTGMLNEHGFFINPKTNLRKTDRHPDTNVIFKEFRIPYIEDAVKQAKQFHAFISDIHSIGWDIAIGENGPIFIEGNDNWEICGPQVCIHGMKKEFERYYK